MRIDVSEFSAPPEVFADCEWFDDYLHLRALRYLVIREGKITPEIVQSLRGLGPNLLKCIAQGILVPSEFKQYGDVKVRIIANMSLEHCKIPPEEILRLPGLTQEFEYDVFWTLYELCGRTKPQFMIDILARAHSLNLMQELYRYLPTEDASMRGAWHRTHDITNLPFFQLFKQPVPRTPQKQDKPIEAALVEEFKKSTNFFEFRKAANLAGDGPICGEVIVSQITRADSFTLVLAALSQFDYDKDYESTAGSAKYLSVKAAGFFGSYLSPMLGLLYYGIQLRNELLDYMKQHGYIVRDNTVMRPLVAELRGPASATP